MTKNTSKTIKMTQNTLKSLKDKNTLKDLQISKEYWSFQRFEYIFLFILQVFSYFWPVQRFHEHFWSIEVLGVFCSFFRFWGYFGRFQIFLVILEHFRAYWSFQCVKVYFLLILDVWGILVIYKVSRFENSFQLFWSSQRFWGYFSHFRDLGAILVN